MMRSYVCQQCRLQLPRRLIPPRQPQLQSRATIVSFRRPQDPSQPISDAQQSPEAAQSEPSAVPQEPAQDPRITHESHGQDAPVWRISRKPTLGTTGHSQGAVLAGRYSRAASGRSLLPQNHNDETSAESTSDSSSVGQTINSLLGRNNVEEAWEVFDRTFTSRDVPALSDPPLSDIPLLTGGKLFTRLALSVSQEFGRGIKEAPTPTQVLFRYEQLDIAPPRVWNQTIAQLTYQFLRSMEPPSQREAPATDITFERDTEAILGELLSLWRLFFQRHGQQQVRDSLESISPDWKTIPEGDMSFGEAGKRFGARLQHFHPTHSHAPELQYSAINIFNYFHAETQPPRNISERLRQQNQPFLRLLTATLAGSDIVGAFRHAEVNPQIRSLSEKYQRSIASQMDLAPSLASSINGIDPSASPEQKASYLQESFLKRIGRQVLMQANVREVEKIWTQAQKTYKSSDGKSQIPPPVYNAFLSGFMTLFQPDHTVKIWNHMIANGVTPDIETWNAMLMGCAKANDLAGMNAVWERMLRAGMEPDQRCWTTRVHSVIGTHAQVEKGLAILDEMGKRWLSAEAAIQDAKNPAKGKGARNLPINGKLVNNFTKPAIGVINGAIDGIAQLPTRDISRSRSKGLALESKVSYVHRILQWAGKFDIRPDTRTYNALIKLYLAGNDFPTAFQILGQMERDGIEGDLATHTMLLRAAFDNQKFDTLSHQEQADRVLGLFDQLEQGGLKPNTYVYQIAVDRLLKNFSNYQGVRAVIDHMMSRGFVVSPQIYTSLVTHYFQQDPPALREIDSLVTRILGPPAAPTDRFLFDRIIEGYAKAGQLASMMTVLTKMSSHGKRPSFVALLEVVKALYHAREWDRARAIVRDVQQGVGVAKDGPTTMHTVDRDQFFYTINNLAPELLEDLAGDHLKSPVRARNEREQMQYEQMPYEQPPYQQEPYEPEAHGHAPNDQEHYQQPQDIDHEYVNAEHENYLSFEPEPEVPQQLWTMGRNPPARRR